MNSREPGLIERAARLAAQAHTGQTRKGNNSPYITHPFMVALKLIKYDFGDVVIAAALAHDVLEDTAVTEEELGKELGEKVSEEDLKDMIDEHDFDNDMMLNFEEFVRMMMAK